MSQSKSSSNSFGSDLPKYSTQTPQKPPVVSENRSNTQIVSEEIITPYENDSSLVFEDLADFLRLRKIKMSNKEKLGFIAAVVKAYNLSDTCKASINVQCLIKFGGSI